MSTEPNTPTSTKTCPCGNTALVEMTSLNCKHCGECGNTIPWPLDDGQKPLHGHSRSGRTWNKEKQS